MRKFLLGVALLAPTFAGAQTLPTREQSGFDTGLIVNCIGLDGVSTARCLVPERIMTDATGNPMGTATNPIVTSAGGTKGDLDQSSTRQGVSYSVGTGIVSVPQNNFLNVVFTCAAPSGSVCIVYLRGYGNATANVMQYQNFRSPTAISGGTVKTVGNKSLAANAVASTSSISYATAATAIATGTPAVTDFIFPNSETLITPATVLKPGDTIGVSLSNVSALAAANSEVKFIEAETTL